MERFVIRRSAVVIVICPHLEGVVRQVDESARAVLIENAPGGEHGSGTGSAADIRNELGIGATTPLIVYTGTFEAYQGLDLLFSAARLVIDDVPDARVVLVGGQPDQIDRARAQARAAGVETQCLFLGQRPAADIPQFLEAADVLVSPRSTGWNTPLKIYQYLRAGKPIVATRLLTHTQVLDDSVAVLTPADPDGFAAGILAVLRDRERARAIGHRARELADTKYTYEAYLDRTRVACASLARPSAPQIAGSTA
jgi:glycosyltransferase involved in cell wall biosynthesis